MTEREKGRALGKKINDNALIASIPFVLMAQAEQIDDVTIAEHADVFLPWSQGASYAAKEIRLYNGVLYRCAQAHTASDPSWLPDAVPALWSRIGDPGDEYPEWSQPLGAQDAYDAGATVTHNGKRWTNTHGAGNVWEPGVFGWTEVCA